MGAASIGINLELSRGSLSIVSVCYIGSREWLVVVT